MNRPIEQRDDEMQGMVVRFNTSHEEKETYREAMRRIEVQEAQAEMRRKLSRTMNSGMRRHFDRE